MLTTLGVSVSALVLLAGFRYMAGDTDTTDSRSYFASAGDSGTATFTCTHAEIVDGDTLRCGRDRIRLHGIDAPEMPGHCRPGRNCAPGDPYASTENLRRLVGGATLECRRTDTDRYGRIVARCSVEGRDLSCGQLDGGYAIRRYGTIFC